MTEKTTAADRLRMGDQVDEAAAGRTVADAAAALGIPVATAEKARWLARSYTPADRTALGATVLNVLTPSHLELAARLGDLRPALLRAAAAERMSVRALRHLVDAAPAPGSAASPAPAPGGAGAIVVLGAVEDLASASASLARYATWDDSRLQKLLDGPNGHVVRALADAGHRLRTRLDAAS